MIIAQFVVYRKHKRHILPLAGNDSVYTRIQCLAVTNYCVSAAFGIMGHMNTLADCRLPIAGRAPNHRNRYKRHKAYVLNRCDESHSDRGTYAMG